MPASVARSPVAVPHLPDGQRVKALPGADSRDRADRAILGPPEPLMPTHIQRNTSSGPVFCEDRTPKRRPVAPISASDVSCRLSPKNCDPLRIPGSSDHHSDADRSPDSGNQNGSPSWAATRRLSC